MCMVLCDLEVMTITIKPDLMLYIFLTKVIAARNEVAPSYHRVRGLYFLAVIFATTIALLYKRMLHSLLNMP